MRTPGLSLALLAAVLASQVPAAEPVTLQERFDLGHQYHVTMRSELSGQLTPPATKDKPNPKPLQLRGDSAFEYTERVLAVENRQVTKTARSYRRAELKRSVADRPQESKPVSRAKAPSETTHRACFLRRPASVSSRCAMVSSVPVYRLRLTHRPLRLVGQHWALAAQSAQAAAGAWYTAAVWPALNLRNLRQWP